jgi:hypothetical protein
MASRKFAVGDRVRLSLDNSLNHNPRDVYAISRMLPAQGDVWLYRVRREGDGLERAVSETQLVKMTSEQPTDRTQIEMQRDIQRVRNANAFGRARSAARRH